MSNLYVSLSCKTTDLPPVALPVVIEMVIFDEQDHSVATTNIMVNENLDEINHDLFSKEEIGTYRRFGYDNMTAFSVMYNFITTNKEHEDSIYLLTHNEGFEMNVINNLMRLCEYPESYFDSLFGSRKINLQSLLHTLGLVYRESGFEYIALDDLLITFGHTEKEITGKTKPHKQFMAYKSIINTLRKDFYSCPKCKSTAVDGSGKCVICGHNFAEND
jgi:hypothetical protein